MNDYNIYNVQLWHSKHTGYMSQVGGHMKKHAVVQKTRESCCIDASRWWQLFKRIFYILAVAPPSMWRTVAANDQTQGPNSVISPANVSLSKWTFILPLRHCAVFQTDWENLSVNPTVLPSSLPPQMRRWWRTPIRPVTFPGVRCPVTARPQEAPHPEAPRAPGGSTRPENTMR